MQDSILERLADRDAPAAAPSRFVWYDLMTADLDAAAAFYGAVVGWTLTDAGMPGVRYSIIGAGACQVGGMTELSADARAAGAKPGWIGYLYVADVDAEAAEIAAAGGAVLRAPDDIPGVGRFATVADPQGAAFHLFRPDGDGESRAFEPATPGHAGWNELHAKDGPAAFGFYAARFGWGKGEAIDMGEMGTYQLFAPAERAEAIGAMMTSPMMPAPTWLFYWCVEDIDAAAARIAANGGQVLMDPHEVPGGAWIVQATDPQGAMFALLGQRGQ